MSENIVAVAVEHQFLPVNHSSIGPEDHCRCGFRPRGWSAWAEHFADALIAAEPIYAHVYARSNLESVGEL